jgi:hypothetical protein
MAGIFFTILFSYLLIRFIFGFVIPVGRTYIKMKRKMREMNGFPPSPHANTRGSQPKFSSKAQTTHKADYIDFEEIK